MSAPPVGDGIAYITFDFWNTLYSADDGAMDIVRPRRQQALRGLLEACGVAVGDAALAEAYRLGFDAYLAAWHEGRHFGAPDQVRFMLAHFGVAPDAADETLVDETARAIEDVSRLAPLRLLAGVRETIPGLAAAGYTLGVISDTSLTPGRIMQEFLAADGLLEHFTVLTFSDVTGFTKPDRRMFEITLAELQGAPEAAAHVGDTPRTDIAGAQAMGMVAVRCAAAVDHQDPPAADFVITDHREIPDILRSATGGVPFGMAAALERERTRQGT